MSCSNPAAKLARDRASLHMANLKRDVPPFRAPIERARRTIASRWKPFEFELAVLPRQIVQTPLGPDCHFRDIRRQLAKANDLRIRMGNFGDLLGLDVNVGKDARLARMDHAGRSCLPHNRGPLGDPREAAAAKP